MQNASNDQTDDEHFAHTNRIGVGNGTGTGTGGDRLRSANNGNRQSLQIRRKRRPSKTPMWVMVFLVGTIVLAGVGFMFKLVEFITSWVQSDGTDFAIVPVATYLAVAGGYLCFFVWAFRKGMFHDIEAPKYRMLEMQDEIDARGGRVQ